MVDLWSFILVSFPAMITLGLGHALDPDHITAIDNLVRLHNAANPDQKDEDNDGVGDACENIIL